MKVLNQWTARRLRHAALPFAGLVLDFRGHGESERPAHGYRVSRLARDCLDFLEAVDGISN